MGKSEMCDVLLRQRLSRVCVCTVAGMVPEGGEGFAVG